MSLTSNRTSTPTPTTTTTPAPPTTITNTNTNTSTSPVDTPPSTNTTAILNTTTTAGYVKTTSPSGSKDVPIAAIAGGVVAGAVVLIIVIVVIVLIKRRRRCGKDYDSESEEDDTMIPKTLPKLDEFGRIIPDTAQVVNAHPGGPGGAGGAGGGTLTPPQGVYENPDQPGTQAWIRDGSEKQLSGEDSGGAYIVLLDHRPSTPTSPNPPGLPKGGYIPMGNNNAAPPTGAAQKTPVYVNEPGKGKAPTAAGSEVDPADLPRDHVYDNMEELEQAGAARVSAASASSPGGTDATAGRASTAKLPVGDLKPTPSPKPGSQSVSETLAKAPEGSVLCEAFTQTVTQAFA
ncbi:uncharacterized protein LOC143298171 [Babylonia areolata]|uniref:uncharacterized protein LOC143298171 n=1 Tax=Babylonia areolata TaxID=304850 RepID=UPI003FD4A1A0